MPNTKNTLIVVIMILISLLLISQFGSTTIFKNRPEQQENHGPLRLPDYGASNNNKTLRVEVNVSPLVYTKMNKLSQMFSDNYGIQVELVNRNAKRNMDTLTNMFKLYQNADVMLIDSVLVKPFAMKGFLLPNEQSVRRVGAGPDWLQDYTRWNDITWAVPAYIDPYVMVWNKQTLQSHTGRSDLPQSWPEWRQLLEQVVSSDPTKLDLAQEGETPEGQEEEQNGASPTSDPTDTQLKNSSADSTGQDAVSSERTAQSEADPEVESSIGDQEDIDALQLNELLQGEVSEGNPLSAWFAWNEDDPYALLSLMWRLGMISPDNRTADQSIPMLGTEAQSDPWLQSLTAWSPYRSLFSPVAELDRDKLWDRLAQGDYLIALVPYSEAMIRLRDPLEVEQPQVISPPRSQWIRSSSYVIAANTTLGEEAANWVSYITQRSIQMDLMEAVSLLPADQGIYEQSWSLMNFRVPPLYIQGHAGLTEAIHRTSLLEQWSKRALKWVEGNETVESLVEQWNEVWKTPNS